jgi:hypothetical protein
MNEEITKGLFEEFETLKRQLVITDYHKVVKLVAIGECPEDYYYVVYDGKRLAWTSCLTRIIQLKGKIDDQDYFELEKNKVQVKIGLRKKWYENDNPTCQIALYKLIANEDEGDRINSQKTKVEGNINIEMPKLTIKR